MKTFTSTFKIMLLCILTSLLLASCDKEDDLNSKNDDAKKLPYTNVDPDGNEYTPITIGTQVWMKENLRTTKFNDGTEIPQFKTTTEELRAETEPAYTVYPHSNAGLSSEQEVLNEYGALYNWYAVNTNKLCPGGWHVPSIEEWETLGEFLGGNEIAGGKIKEVGTEHWVRNNETTTNETDFSGRAAGKFGDFAAEIKSMAYWWTSTERDSTSSYYKSLHNYYDWIMDKQPAEKRIGYSVRCIKD